MFRVIVVVLVAIVVTVAIVVVVVVINVVVVTVAAMSVTAISLAPGLCAPRGHAQRPHWQRRRAAAAPHAVARVLGLGRQESAAVGPRGAGRVFASVARRRWTWCFRAQLREPSATADQPLNGSGSIA